MLSCLFIAALWSPAGKGLASWLLFVMFNCVFVTFPCGIQGQVWYLIVSNPDLCSLAYFYSNKVQRRTQIELFKPCYLICLSRPFKSIWASKVISTISDENLACTNFTGIYLIPLLAAWPNTLIYRNQYLSKMYLKMSRYNHLPSL